MSSTQLSGGTFSSFFKSFFAPQRSPHTPNLPPPKPPLAIRVPARFQVESDWHLEHDLTLSAYAIWEKSFPFSGDFLLLAGDCGRVNPNNLPNSTIAADHQTAYKGMLSRISKNYKHVFLISGNNEPKTLRGGPRIAETMLSLKSFESDIPNLTVLEKQSADISGLGYDSTILGCTLWSRLRSDAAPGAGDAGQWTGETDAEHNARFEHSLAWLRAEVKRVRKERPSHRIIIMTHHAPTMRWSAQNNRQDGGREFYGGRRDIREARLHLIHERSSRAGTVVLTGWPRRDHDLMSVELPSNVYIIVASNCLEVPVVFLVEHAQGSLRLDW
ncbi:hypothetical protein B0J14DRAFT_561610 [Halenospora varia]|nr:hypothetical protein B0J14DRAFT_561610 [Halenospora varia]